MAIYQQPSTEFYAGDAQKLQFGFHPHQLLKLRQSGAQAINTVGN